MTALNLFGNLGAIGSGFEDMQRRLQEQQSQQYANALRAFTIQQALKQQQAQAQSWGALQNLFGGGQGGVPQPPQAPTAPFNLPQVPQLDGRAMGGPLPSPAPPRTAGGMGVGGAGFPVQGETVRGSWFGNAPGWRDPSDSGLQASGQPVSAGPGIALPSRATLGQQFDVTAPSGQTLRLPQTDVGPAKWTGRGVDINAPAAEAFGYSPQNFPTDQNFRVQLASANAVAQQLKASTPPAVNQAGMAGARNILSQMGNPLAMVGRIDPGRLIKAINDSNPNADDATKTAIFSQLFPMLTNEGKLGFAEAMQLMNYQQRGEEFQQRQEQQRQEFGIRQQELQQNRQFMQDIATRRVEQTQQRLDAQPAPAVEMSESDKNFWANVLRTGGHLPPGLSRTAAGSKLVQELMARVPGQAGGDAGSFIANASTVKADDRSLSNMTKMADAATSFERTANMNFDRALELSKDAVPTDWGPWLNKFVENAETQAGNTSVPPYVTAMLTAANEYAKIMSGSTGAQGSTVDSRREAAQLFSPYLSSGQIDRVVAIAKTDMANRKASLYGQVDDIRSRLRAAGSPEASATRGQIPGTTTQAPAPQIGAMSKDELTQLLNDPAAWDRLTPEQKKQIADRVNAGQ